MFILPYITRVQYSGKELLVNPLLNEQKSLKWGVINNANNDGSANSEFVANKQIPQQIQDGELVKSIRKFVTDSLFVDF